MYGDISYKDHYVDTNDNFQYKTQSIPDSGNPTFKGKSR